MERNISELMNDIESDLDIIEDKIIKYIEIVEKQKNELKDRIMHSNNKLKELKEKEQKLQQYLEIVENEYERNLMIYSYKNRTNCKVKQIESGSKLNSIDFVESGIYKCKKCNENFIFDTIQLAYFASEDSKERKGFIKYETYYCTRCKHHFLDKTMRGEITKKLGRYIIKENTISNNNTAINNKDKKSSNIERKLYKEDIKVNNNEADSEFFYSLNKESPLHALGYNVSKLSREQRWHILRVKAIPKLGVEEIIREIRYNISLRDGYQKYSSAVAAWKYDIKRLIEYKKNGGKHEK